jgi:long-chain acyl-CoA synthetase
LVVERATALHAAGLPSGQRVALIAESSTLYLATALAVWWAGAVLVTIYPSSGADDMRYALESSDTALIVVDGGIDRAMLGPSANRVPIVEIDTFPVSDVKQDTTPNPTGLREPLAMIRFSSGTSSRPKAIMTTSRGVFNTADTYGEVWHLTSDDRGIVCLPMAWMYGLASTSLAILLRGGTVVIVRRARPELLVQAISECKATFLAGVSTTFAKLIEYAESHGLDRSSFGSLRLCVAGGEPRHQNAFDRWAGP